MLKKLRSEAKAKNYEAKKNKFSAKRRFLYFSKNSKIAIFFQNCAKNCGKSNLVFFINYSNLKSI